MCSPARPGYSRRKSLVAVGVRRDPRRLRFDATGHPHAPLGRSARAVERPVAAAGEERGAVRRALLDGDRLERQVEHRRDDLAPQRAARAAARDAADVGPNAERAQQLERVAQPVRDAFEHRAHERAAIVAQRQADEGAARVRIGVRRPLAGEVRREEQPLAAGRPLRRLGDERRRTTRRARPRRAATAASRPRRASRPSRATSRAPRGRRRARAPRRRARTARARRRRRPTCRARPTPAPAR